MANLFAERLVSHGFAWAGIDNIDTYYPMDDQLIDQPRDILFALDQVASNPPEGLEGLIDTARAGTRTCRNPVCYSQSPLNQGRRSHLSPTHQRPAWRSTGRGAPSTTLSERYPTGCPAATSVPAWLGMR